MQPLEDIDKWYEIADPWQYKNNPDDLHRRQRILQILPDHYQRAIDIGGGEGWISKDLPADSIEVYEVSQNALKRLPEGILGVTEATGQYDLIIATGVMYHHYDYQDFLDIIKKHSSGAVLLCNIAGWEVEEVKDLGTPSLTEEFPYREFTQRLRFYENI